MLIEMIIYLLCAAGALTQCDAAQSLWTDWNPSANEVIADTYYGVEIALEDRCTPYDRDDYPYSSSIEPTIQAGLDGQIYSPFDGLYYQSLSEVDIEHMVATSEAHDSGLCAADSATRKAFASDLRNLTLATPALNRYEKAGHDFGEWRPPLNQCWYGRNVLKVKRAYGLTIDPTEYETLKVVLRDCGSVEMYWANTE